MAYDGEQALIVLDVGTGMCKVILFGSFFDVFSSSFCHLRLVLLMKILLNTCFH